jgi:hypothetical protein
MKMSFAFASFAIFNTKKMKKSGTLVPGPLDTK